MDTHKFPGGTEVKILRKKDVIDCIDANIIDKEVALAIVQQCEIDAANYLRQERWVGIPFTGSIRISQVDKLANSKENQELIEYAANNSTPEQYCLFKKNLARKTNIQVKAQRYYNYVLSIAVNKNRQLFKKMCKEKGEGYARIHFFLHSSIVAISNEYEYVNDGEDNND